MELVIDKLSKRFGNDWILKSFDAHITTGSKVAVKGLNGTGKSTFLRLISGYLSMTKGTITYTQAGNEVSRDDLYQNLSYAAPYITFHKDLTATEVYDLLKAHASFRSSNAEEFLSIVELDTQRKKYLRDYSDGMRQRLALAIAIDCKSDLLLLDEPTSYLDETYKKWFFSLLARYQDNRTIIIASNADEDFQFCDHMINSNNFT
jgi:ABC-type multidrug transport system ATPase subunit